MLFCNAKGRLSKKARTDASAEDVEPEKILEDTGGNTDTAMDDLVPQEQDTYADPPEVNPASPHADPPSPTKDKDLPSPARDAANSPVPSKGGDDDVIITGTGHTLPHNPVALSKHTAKEEFAAMGKGKGKTDLSSFVNLSAQELHSGYLNRLYTSRDYEAGLVNMMKERYEVIFQIFLNFSCSVYQLHCSPQGPVCLLKTNQDFEIKNTSTE